MENGINKLSNGQTQIDASRTLSSIEQKNPANAAKYATSQPRLDATFLYSLDKRPKDVWNFSIVQYQHHKSWMLHLEYDFLNSRELTITGVQYRFGL